MPPASRSFNRPWAPRPGSAIRRSPRPRRTGRGSHGTWRSPGVAFRSVVCEFILCISPRFVCQLLVFSVFLFSASCVLLLVFACCFFRFLCALVGYSCVFSAFCVLIVGFLVGCFVFLFLCVCLLVFAYFFPLCVCVCVLLSWFSCAFLPLFVCFCMLSSLLWAFAPAGRFSWYKRIFALLPPHLSLFAFICLVGWFLRHLALGWFGLALVGLAGLELAWLGLGWLWSGWLGLGWLGLALVGLAWLGLGWVGSSPVLANPRIPPLAVQLPRAPAGGWRAAAAARRSGAGASLRVSEGRMTSTAQLSHNQKPVLKWSTQHHVKK